MTEPPSQGSQFFLYRFLSIDIGIRYLSMIDIDYWRLSINCVWNVHFPENLFVYKTDRQVELLISIDWYRNSNIDDWYRLLPIISSSINFVWSIFIVQKISLCTKLNLVPRALFPAPPSKPGRIALGMRLYKTDWHSWTYNFDLWPKHLNILKEKL